MIHRELSLNCLPDVHVFPLCGSEIFVLFLPLQEHAVNEQHLWVDTDASGNFCYIADQECTVSMGI